MCLGLPLGPEPAQEPARVVLRVSPEQLADYLVLYNDGNPRMPREKVVEGFATLIRAYSDTVVPPSGVKAAVREIRENLRSHPADIET